jgi:RNA polymerase primary sigma factor
MLKRSPAPPHTRASKKSETESKAHTPATSSSHPAPSPSHPEPSHDEPAPERRSEHTAYSADTSLKLYLREIGKVKLLSQEDEVELAARIRKGDKKAREQMIKANLRLVVKIARDYEGLGLPLLDLISEGNIGLMKAVERFDPAKGGKLSTYGSWWIKQSMKRALANQSKTIRLPVHMVDKISKMNRAARRLQELLGREPTDEELAEELHVKTARVAMMRMAATRPTSLDAPVGDADNGTFAEVVRDENADDPFEELQAKGVTGMLKDLVTNLTSREANILRARYGLDGGRMKTLEEIGAEWGITRERARQVQNNALRKLRAMIEKLEKSKTHD